MQGIGYILIGSEKIKVLWRLHNPIHRFAIDKGWYLSLKLRKTGEDGMLFEAESEYLSTAPKTLKRLREGKVIKL